MTGYLFFCRVFNRLAMSTRSPVDPTDGTIRVEANVFHYNAALSVRGLSDGGVRNRAWMKRSGYIWNNSGQ
jgi:hypothetical protein